MHLAKRECDAVGFIPRDGVRSYIEAGGVTVVTENGDPAGYLLHKPALSTCPTVRPILQAAICYDARRRHLGMSLVDELVRQATAAGQSVLQLKCREELQANAFWAAAGFVPVGWQDAGRRRGGRVILWARQLAPIGLADLLLKRVERNRGPGGFYSSKPVEIHPADTLPPAILRLVDVARAAAA